MFVFTAVIYRNQLFHSVSESRLNAITAISVIGEVPEGRKYLKQNWINEIALLKKDKNELICEAASECCKIIEWIP